MSAWLTTRGDTINGLSADLAFAHVLADAADAITRSAFLAGRAVDHELKADGSPVSATDKAAERTVLDLVVANRPTEAVVGEEVGVHGTSRRTWTVDGIDGTTNFVKGSPLWSTLIALVEDDMPVLCVKSSPAQGRRWWAARGRGAWSCEYGSSVAQRLAIWQPRADRLITACVDLAWSGHPIRASIDRLATRVNIVGMTTHPAVMVASGEIDLAVQAAGGPWDFAGVMPLVWEAGGRCVDLDGREVRRPQPPIIYVGNVTGDEVRQLLGH